MTQNTGTNSEILQQPMRVTPVDDSFFARVQAIADEITLGMKSRVRVGRKRTGAVFVQIECERVDVITKEVGIGRGGKGEPSEFSTDNEIIQMIHGLFLSYWTHEARENFEWCGRRIYGPHMKAEALWTVARQVDHRSLHHVEDNLDEISAMDEFDLSNGGK